MRQKFMSEEQKHEEECQEQAAIDVEVEDEDVLSSVDSEESADESSEPTILLEEAQRELELQTKRAAEHWDKYLRLGAEFENFKKRAARDRLEAIKFANQALLESLIPTLDSFEMAMAAVENAKADSKDSMDSLKQGIELVHKQLKEVIKEWGLEEIDASGKAFDPAWHEAVSQQESDEAFEGQIVQQIRKGYKLKDRLIRPANVVVAKAISASAD